MEERSTADANCAGKGRPRSAAPARDAATLRIRGDTIECVSCDDIDLRRCGMQRPGGARGWERRVSRSLPNPRDAMPGHVIPVWLGRTGRADGDGPVPEPQRRAAEPPNDEPTGRCQELDACGNTPARLLENAAGTGAPVSDFHHIGCRSYACRRTNSALWGPDGVVAAITNLPRLENWLR